MTSEPGRGSDWLMPRLLGRISATGKAKDLILVIGPIFADTSRLSEQLVQSQDRGGGTEGVLINKNIDLYIATEAT